MRTTPALFITQWMPVENFFENFLKISYGTCARREAFRDKIICIFNGLLGGQVNLERVHDARQVGALLAQQFDTL